MTGTWRNRIVGYGEEQPEQLLANPRNFRIHPKAQQEALLGVMREVGVVDDVIVNQQTGFVVDGHLRVALAISEHQPTVPVKYVDLTEQEEALILATFDPIAAMAATDKTQLDALLREVQSGEAGVQAMLAELAEREGIVISEQADTAQAARGPYHVKQAALGVWACHDSDLERYGRVANWKRTNGEAEPYLVQDMAADLAQVIQLWQPIIKPSWVVTTPPQGASEGQWFLAGEVAKAVGVRLGLDVVTTLQRTDEKKYHHPKASLSQAGYAVASVPSDVSLVIDDVITSGTTMRLALEALRAVGVAAFGFGWLYKHRITE